MLGTPSRVHVCLACNKLKNTHSWVDRCFYDNFDSQDAELFLILPRLVILSGLWEPSYGALLHSFLPDARGSRVSPVRPFGDKSLLPER